MCIKIDDLPRRIHDMIIQSRSALCAQLRDIDPAFNLDLVRRAAHGRQHGHEEEQKEGKNALTRKLAEEAEVVLEAINLRLEDGNCNHIAERDLGGNVEEKRETAQEDCSAKGPDMEEGVSCGSSCSA